MEIKNISYCELIANLIVRSLVYLEEIVPDTDTRKIYLVTRSQHVLDIFGIHDYPFKEYDLSTKQIQAVDVKTGTPVVINLENTENASIPGDPELLSPPVIGNPGFFDMFTEKDIADIQLPFCMTIINLKNAGCYGDVCVSNGIADKILYFSHLTKSCGVVLPPEIDFFKSDYIQAMCNKMLHTYITPKKLDLLTARYILKLSITDSTDLNIDTYEGIESLLADPEKIVKLWGDYLRHLVATQIEMYEAEFKTVVTEQLQDMSQREKDFLQLQYERAISDLRKIDIEKALHKFGNNTLLMLRYFPRDIKMPEELIRVSTFTAYDNCILEVLAKEGIDINQEDFILDYVDFIISDFSRVSLSTQINNNYIDKMKAIRLQQIKQCSAEIVETIKKDVEDLDEEDIQDIISSMQDFESFEEKLNNCTDISSVIQFWPSVLLPAPEYVTRLTGVTQNFINIQMA